MNFDHNGQKILNLWFQCIYIATRVILSSWSQIPATEVMATNNHIQQFKSHRKVCNVRSGAYDPISSLLHREQACSFNLIERLVHLRHTRSVFSSKFTYIRPEKILVLLKCIWFSSAIMTCNWLPCWASFTHLKYWQVFEYEVRNKAHGRKREISAMYWFWLGES